MKRILIPLLVGVLIGFLVNTLFLQETGFLIRFVIDVFICLAVCFVMRRNEDVSNQ